MPWQVVERNISPTGGVWELAAHKRAWEGKHGRGNWVIGYETERGFITEEAAIEAIYYKSYEEHFDSHPNDLDELVHLAGELRNPHAEAIAGVDLQVPAIMDYLNRNELNLRGPEVVDIGAWDSGTSPPIGIRLSAAHVTAVGNHKMSLEKFWQSKKCLAVWKDQDRYNSGVSALLP